jgi:hypothetical protein
MKIPIKILFLSLLSLALAHSVTAISLSLDPNFHAPFFATPDHGSRVLLLPDGKYIGGYQNVDTITDQPTSSLNRYLADGTLDTTFRFSGDYIAVAADVQPDGKLIVFANRSSYGQSMNQVLRLNVDGSIDNSFNSAATTVTEPNLTAVTQSVRNILVQSDGKILLCSVTDAEAATSLWGRSNNDGDLYPLDRFSTSSLATSPSISVQPQSQTVTAPGTTTFSVTATGTAPLLYQWNKNGAVITGATSSTYTTPATTTGANGASFTVTVTDSSGSTTSTSAILTVYPAPTLNSSPVGPVLIGGQPQNQEVIAPASATFSATAIGTAPITYQWNKNGAPINGATSASYTTPATTSVDNGASFTVTVTNSVNGFTSTPATLTVTSAPVAPTIVAPPSTISVGQGSSALFHVFATGTAPLSYQWSKNGTLISDATDATYKTPSTTGADNNAQFSVIVTNSAGSTPGVSAPLIVSSQVAGLGGFQPLATLPSIQPGMPNDLVGGQYRFQVVANPSPGLKIIFGFNGLYNPGSANVYDMESNVYSSTLTFANGGCTTWPLLGTNTDSVASLRNATADYPFHSGQQPAVGSAINTSDPVNWPVQTYIIDNIPNLWKSDSISQFNINGIEGLVTIQRGGTLTNISSFVRCGLTMLPGTYRMWTITTQLAGHATVITQVVAPDADARYLTPYEVLAFASEFLSFPGTFTVQYWDFAYMRESNPVWTPVSTFKTNNNYDGGGQDFGIHVVSVSGKDRIEFSNVPGNSYLPGGELPFSIAPSPPPTLLNISTRMHVLTGDQVLIAGFIVTGTDPKKVIIRGMGPSLNGVGVTLSDPTLELHQGNTTLATNDNWKINDQTGQSQETDIRATTIPPTNDLESAIVATLSPGNYTAILAGKNGGTGVGVVEVYDLAQAANSKLANISSRGFVDINDNVMIGGFIVGGGSGGGTAKVIVRAIGPSLSANGNAVPGRLADPTLELHDESGTTIATNDNWKINDQTGQSQEADIRATTIPPTNDLESALVATLVPGNYTAIVRGKNNTTGIAVVEAYNLQ